MQTSGIAQVAARIRQIQSRVEEPAVPGQFRDMLRRSLDSNAQPAAGDATHAPGDVDDVEGRDHRRVASFRVVQATTLGTMLGISSSATTPTFHGPVAGVFSAQELDQYLAVHDIEGRNGRLTDHDLVTVSGGWHGNARLLPPAATAWEEMRAAAAIDGIDLKVIDSYRTWESQERAHEAHLRGEKKANVLAPGHSEHGNGLAVDVTNGSIIGRDDPEWAWLQSNATRFGWFPISNETWHWEFRGINA
jgi:D-alanyl-D-alanine carboxypeptidase